MYCTQCGLELRADDRFCSRCGNRTEMAKTAAASRPLLLDKHNKKIAGVCAGFARYFEVDISLMRVIWLAVALTFGVGVVAYLAAWIIVPSDRANEARMAFAPHPQTN
jgi:phage shock protein C